MTVASGSIASQKSPTLDYLSYDFPPQVTVNPLNWEYWVLSTTDVMSLSGTTHSFTDPVGFLMGLTKNRLNALLTTDSSFDATSTDAAALTLDVDYTEDVAKLSSDVFGVVNVQS